MTSTNQAQVPAGLADDLGLLLSRLGTVVRLRIADSLAPAGLTMRQFAVLRALGAEEGISQAALGERLKIDASSIVLVLDECQKAGWVERRPSPSDRRRYAIHLTPAGKRTLVKARRAVARAEDEFFESLDASRRGQLHELLATLSGAGQVVSSPQAGRHPSRATA